MIKILSQEGLSITEIYKMSVKKFMLTISLYFDSTEEKEEVEELTDDFLALF